MLEELDGVPILDAHTHLVGGRLSARGLHDILLYHMSVSDLYAAGCPDGARLTQYPAWPDRAEAERRITRALPFLPLVKNTSTAWCIRKILKDLYGWRRRSRRTTGKRSTIGFASAPTTGPGIAM
jgi:glucuronate isomerase